MNTVAIVRALWVLGVVAGAALVGQAVVETRTQGPLVGEPSDTAPSDAGIQLPRGYAMGTSDDLGSVRSSWDVSL